MGCGEVLTIPTNNRSNTVLSTLSVDLKNSNTELSTLITTQTKHDKVTADLNSKITVLSNQISTLELQLQTTKSEISALETSNTELKALFIQKDEPDDMPEYKLTESEKLIGIMVKNGMVASNGEGKRMISQGGVRLDKEKVEDIHSTIEAGENMVLKVGKRKFLRIIK